MRLNKYIASCGVCSRREADKLIEAGKVTVDGELAAPGVQVLDSSVVMVDGKAVTPNIEKTVLAYYKETGVTCTEKDEHAEKTITEALDYPKRLTYAGRLDKDSEGLIIMTDDGDLIQAMMKGSNMHEKEYVVTVDKKITPRFIKEMSGGVYLEELDRTTRKCVVTMNNDYSFNIVLTQGLNRQIRRMCEALGYNVISLKRIRVMNIELGDLQPGRYREIQGTELQKLYSMCNM
jgi:23S rRNA pseudouridine2604 synthase